MIRKVLFFYLSASVFVWAQSVSAQTPMPQAAPNQPTPSMPNSPPPEPSPMPMPAPIPPPQPESPPNNPPASSNANTPKNLPKKAPTLREVEANISKRVKSPFMIPTDLYLKIKRKQGEKMDQAIDMSIDPKRRWPLKSYRLVGVLTNVAKPKALITDPSGKLHSYKTKEFIANSGAFISEIAEGEVVIIERGTELIMQLQDLREQNMGGAPSSGFVPGPVKN